LEEIILEENITIDLGKVEWKLRTALDCLWIGSNGNLSSTLNNLLAALSFNCSSWPSATEYVTYQSLFDLRTSDSLDFCCRCDFSALTNWRPCLTDMFLQPLVSYWRCHQLESQTSSLLLYVPEIKIPHNITAMSNLTNLLRHSW
jgi:hypothetical protein